MKIKAGLTDHIIGMRACVPPVRGFLVQGGMHEPVERQGEFLMAVYRPCCVLRYCEHQHRSFQVLTNMIRDRLFAFHSGTITSFVCVCTRARARARACARVCVDVCVRFMNNWFFGIPP